MKLRRRLALVFAGATSLTMATAFALTVVAFKHAQERQLDQSLLLRARWQADDVARVGGHALLIERESNIATRDVDYLVKYGALYRVDGAVMASTPTFGDRPPTLTRLGIRPGVPLPTGGFDFPSRGLVLRGVVMQTGAAEAPSGPILLLAAPRGDLDKDTQDLLKLMGIVLLLSAAVSLLIGGWIGGRMVRGVESIALLARRVSQGDLRARMAPAEVARDDEIRSLAADLNQMIDRLAALIDAGNRFVSHAAHELRSPLAALRGELELALRHPRPVEGYRSAIDEALDDTNRLIVLAEDLLVLARTGIAAQKDTQLSASLQEVVGEAVRASLARAQNSRHVEVQVEDAMLSGRRADLSRMVRNLLDNAVAHAPEGTSVLVVGGRTSPTGPPLIQLSVEDRGPGVPEAIRERIFEPFFRGEEEREHSGAGLGLAIAREIARVHGGDLVLVCQDGVTRFVATLQPGLREAS